MIDDLDGSYPESHVFALAPLDEFLHDGSEFHQLSPSVEKRDGPSRVGIVCSTFA